MPLAHSLTGALVIRARINKAFAANGKEQVPIITVTRKDMSFGGKSFFGSSVRIC